MHYHRKIQGVLLRLTTMHTFVSLLTGQYTVTTFVSLLSVLV
jgi:hypothetical protein